MSKTLADADKEAGWIIKKWAAIAVPVGIVPGSPLLLPGLDMKLISDIARCYEVENYEVDTVLAVVGTSIAGRTAVDVGLTTIPVAGWIVKGFVAGGVSLAAGEAMKNYFRTKSRLA